jgi:phosphate transport system substrate-binding protein
MNQTRQFTLTATTIALFFLTGCGEDNAGTGASESADTNRIIAIDGSSTVYPITEAVAEEFRAVKPDIRVTVGYAGTGGGMKKFIAGSIDICGASRAIKDSEKKSCEEAGADYVELEVAFDGLAVVAHPENNWCDHLTVAQLKEMWRPESAVQKWSDLNPEWPAEKIRLYGPGTDSGTFDYFTKAIVGEEGASRADYAASEDDNVLVTGVQEDKHALGYFGYAYYAENADKLKLLAVDGGDGPVQPTEKTVRAGTYAPLSRPLYVYVRKSSLSNDKVAQFTRFYLDNAANLAREVGYVPISDEAAAINEERLSGAKSE